MGEIAERRAQTESRIKVLRQKLTAAEEIAAGKACVYATGSFGRGEASEYSDLDLFIVGKGSGRVGADGRESSQLKRLDDIRIKSRLIEVTREMGIPEFSGDGRYLVHFSVPDFTKTLGAPEDDVTNTFTARLLLLLESRPLVGDSAYREVLKQVVDAYWRDYADHKQNFMPAFLTNDILRLWRTFCVNYEARTSRVPAEEKARGKIKNYKLKHSRLLTCYSALLYLLAVFELRRTVTQDDVLAMIDLSPTQRLEWLRNEAVFVTAHAAVNKLIQQYEKFLETTNVAEKVLVEKFMDKGSGKAYMDAAYTFGDSMYEALRIVGNNSKFYRLLVV